MSDQPVAAEPVATAAPTLRKDGRFTARDLLNTAVFAVLYAVIVYAIAMLGIISPLVMLLTLPLSAIAAGIPTCCSSPGSAAPAWPRSSVSPSDSCSS